MDLNVGMKTAKEIAAGLRRLNGGLVDEKYDKIAKIMLGGEYKMEHQRVGQKIEEYFRKLYEK